MPEAPETAGVPKQAVRAELPVTLEKLCRSRGCIKLHSEEPQAYQINFLIFVVGDGTMQLL